MKLWALLLLWLHAAYCTKQVTDEKLKVALYYEALCPFCERFINTQLYPAFTKIGSSYLELDFIPYGNTEMNKVNGTWVFNCQHGPDECAINMLEACGIVRNNDQTAQLNYLNCVEGEADATDLKELSKCGSEIKVPAKDLLTCAQGAEGNSLLAKMGEKQGKLQPYPDYVPWLIFNDQTHDVNLETEALEDFFGTACKLLKNEPAACKKAYNLYRHNLYFAGGIKN